MSNAGPPRGRGCRIRQSPARRGGAGLVGRWPYRTTIAVTKKMRDHTAKIGQLSASSFAVIDRAKLTGNVTKTDCEVAATAHFERRNMYDAASGNEEQASAATSIPMDKRESTWIGCRRELKVMDKFNNAAGLASGCPGRGRPAQGGRRGRRGGQSGASSAAGRALGASTGGRDGPAASCAADCVIGDVEDEHGSLKANSARPDGKKAAKKRRAAELSVASEADASRGVLVSLVGVSERQAYIAFWGGPEVRRKPEAAQ